MLRAVTKPSAQALSRWRLLVLILLWLISPISQALKSDRNQPMVVDAREIEMDFRNGSRIYTGKVKAKQGSMKLTADKVELYLKNGSLDKGFAWGKRAVFRQRPDGKDADVIGKALKIEIYQNKNLVILKGKASITQDGSTISGKKITYNMETDKMKVLGNTKTVVQPGAMKPTTKKPGSKISGRKKQQISRKKSGRPHMTFTPKKKNSPTGSGKHTQ
ncbi:MAG TPA: lipopolysaccharide transport periplasmic protein LptA [Gammaproteobacteria bacterium]|nr:lipopolysaccharide transport periplasmic protein LptA [Gammaproteobacteria bacterium]